MTATETPKLAHERRKLSELYHQPKNARVHSKRNLQAIAQSIARFGQVVDLLIRPDGMVVAGNGTLDAMRARCEEDPAELDARGERPAEDAADVTICPEWMTDDDVRALALVLNRTAELAGWDKAVLAAEVDELKAWGEVPGFKPAELRKLTGESGDPASSKDDPPVPAPPRGAAKTKRGDLWRLGDHVLLCGDSFVDVDVDRLLDGKPATMVLTDPPFAIYGSSTGVSNDIADDEMVRPFFEGLGRMISAHLVEFGHAYVHCDWRSYAAVWEGIKRADLTPQNCLVWDKGNFGMGSHWPNAHEFIALFAKLPPTGTMTSKRKSGQRLVSEPGNVLRFERPRGDERQHNAAKPVDMLELIIGKASDEGDIVLDLFGGSGSTLIAAHRAGRRARIIEKNAKACDVILKRYQTVTGLAPQREGKTVDFTAAK